MKTMACAAAAVLIVSGTSSAEIGSGEVERLRDAAEVVAQTRPSIPQDYWDRARCVAVIPDLKKAAFIIGGEYGKGVMSCRSGDSWSAPLFLQLAKGSWGFQAGAEEVDVVMLVMNESGVQKVMRNNVTLGADASIAAGPIGRQANASTDATLTAEILAYSRAKGLFAGLNLSGGVLRPDEDSNRNVYGAPATASTILASRSISAPTEATAFLQGLQPPMTASGSSAAGSNAQGSGTGTAGAPAPSSTSPSATASGQTSPAPPAGTVSNDVPRTTDSDLRAAIVAMQQTVDRMLTDQNGGAPVGTGGEAGAGAATTGSGATVTVSRERLEQLRDQLDALIASLNARGQ